MNAALLLSTLAIGWLLTSLLAAGLLPGLERLSGHWPASRRAWLWLALAGAPPLLTALLALALAAPTVLPALAHCHGASCIAHAPAAPFAGSTGALALAVLMVVAVWGAMRQWHARHLRRELRQLLRWARPRAGFHEMEVAVPLAWSVGYWQPRVYLSQGLLTALSPRGVDAVLYHERAHCRRRDNLRLGVARMVTLPWRPGARRHLLNLLELAQEQACDAAAARELEDPVPVAEALLQVQRMTREHRGAAPGLAFCRGHLEARVRLLLAPPAHAPAMLGWCCQWPLLLLGSALLWALPLHFWLERWTL